MKMFDYITRFRMTSWLGILGSVIMMALSNPAAQAGSNVTLAWDPSPDSSVVGYIVYYGLSGGTTTNSLDAASQTTATVSNLTVGATEFFYVTAYNSQRVQSTPSNLITYTIPAANTPPTISSIANRTISEDTTTGAIGFTVGDIETVAGSLTVSGGSSNPTLVPNANIAFGGTGETRTGTV